MHSNEARRELHNAQRRGDLPWAAGDGVIARAAEQEFDDRCVRATAKASAFPAQRRDAEGAGAILTDPRLEVQASRGLADLWYLEDGDVLCDPRLVVP